MDTVQQRYSKGVVILHWVTALIMIYMLFLGEDLIKVPRGTSLAESNASIHATLGASIFILTVIRVLWRAVTPVPAQPAGVKTWEAWAAKAVHLGFYALLLGLPLTGWLALSDYGVERGGGESVMFFNLFPAMTAPNLGEGIGEIHEIGSKLGILLLALHVLGALKHQFMDRMPFLQRMKLR